MKSSPEVKQKHKAYSGNREQLAVGESKAGRRGKQGPECEVSAVPCQVGS